MEKKKEAPILKKLYAFAGGYKHLTNLGMILSGVNDKVINEENMAKVFRVNPKIINSKVDNQNYSSIICVSKI